jgi:small subunit ribosomal protein S1
MDTERRDLPPPPPLEEGYWKALLHEGEHAEPSPRYNNGYHEYPNGHNGNSYYTNEQSAATLQDWETIDSIMNADEVIELPVIGYNRGGLLVEWNSIRGFVPASQLVDFPTDASPSIRRDALINRIGNHLSLRVIELNPQQNRLVLSERAAQVSPGKRAQILDTLKAGDIIEGDVTNITDFGVFVDLGGLEGLIHISELSWGRVGHPGDVLHRDQHVQVYVLDTNKNQGRIALSVKRLYPDPWQTVDQRYTAGQIIQGRITNVVDFGAFACLEAGLEGLIHVSELAEGHFLHPRNVVSEGQLVHARVLSIDKQARRLGLSLREVAQPEDPS